MISSTNLVTFLFILVVNVAEVVPIVAAQEADQPHLVILNGESATLKDYLGCTSDADCNKNGTCLSFLDQGQKQSVCVVVPPSDLAVADTNNDTTTAEGVDTNETSIIDSSTTNTSLYQECQTNDDCLVKRGGGECLFFIGSDGSHASACHCLEDGVSADFCKSECSIVCLNDGQCILNDLYNTVECQCATGYSGLLCALSNDETTTDSRSHDDESGHSVAAVAISTVFTIFGMLVIGYILRRRICRLYRNQSNNYNDNKNRNINDIKSPTWSGTNTESASSVCDSPPIYHHREKKSSKKKMMDIEKELGFDFSSSSSAAASTPKSLSPRSKKNMKKTIEYLNLKYNLNLREEDEII